MVDFSHGMGKDEGSSSPTVFYDLGLISNVPHPYFSIKDPHSLPLARFVLDFQNYRENLKIFHNKKG